ncbi:hypothetical protein ABTL50_19880, partial [Acinetobacter baumannii]
MLGSDISVNGMLTLTNGSLDISNHVLTINGNIAAGGSGMLYSAGTGSLVVNSASSPAGSLQFSS